MFFVEDLASTLLNSFNDLWHPIRNDDGGQLVDINQTKVLVTRCILIFIDKKYVIEECLP
jgi:hypothetical protein